MTYSRGDVVLVNFPHSDLHRLSRRPALVVQADHVPTGLNQRIVALITTNLKRTGPSRVQVSAASPQGAAMGLRSDSVVVCDNLATVLEREITGVIGLCPDMTTIDQALRAILLP